MRYIVIAVVWLWSVGALASIGDVEQQVGNSVIERQGGDAVTSETGLDIFSLDTVKTANGRTSIVFVDDTRVDVTENSKLIIDEFVYDPNTQTGELALKASLERFATPRARSRRTQDRTSRSRPPQPR